MLTYKHRLPWITNSLRKHINKKNQLYEKGNDIKYNNAYNHIRSKHRYKKNSERHIGTTLNQSAVIYQ